MSSRKRLTKDQNRPSQTTVRCEIHIQNLPASSNRYRKNDTTVDVNGNTDIEFDPSSCVVDLLTTIDISVLEICKMILASIEDIDDYENYMNVYHIVGDNQNGEVVSDWNQTLQSLGFNDQDHLIVDFQRKRSKYHIKEDLSLASKYEQSITNGTIDQSTLSNIVTLEEVIVLTCTTRIFDAEGISMKRTKVFVRPGQLARFLMEDISALWNKNNLKFRYNSKILRGDRTFFEQGVYESGEVSVTGGR